ncbi:hypothetical protein ES703_70080 [subsurface metagenome]
MGGVRASIDVEGRSCWALFDTGARNTYVVQDVAENLPTSQLKDPESVSLGGKEHRVAKNCWFECMIGELPIRGHARVLDKIGIDEDGKRIDVLIGALTMQEWGIRPIPDEERLDMTHYPKEFVEF